MNASRKFTNGLLGFVVLLLVSVSACFAQSTATLAGTVTDPTGAVVPGASVKVRSLSTNVLRETVSDSAGAFVVPSLQPGDYEVRTTAAGFGTSVIKSVTLLVDQSATANVRLGVASAGEIVQVEASAAPIIDSQTITMGQVIDKETVQNIPLNGRHFLDLTNLTPGAVVAPANGFLTSASRGLGANSYITGGAREDANNFQINGINLNDMTQNQITFQPSINTTCRVQDHQFDLRRGVWPQFRFRGERRYTFGREQLTTVRHSIICAITILTLATISIGREPARINLYGIILVER